MSEPQDRKVQRNVAVGNINRALRVDPRDGMVILEAYPGTPKRIMEASLEVLGFDVKGLHSKTNGGTDELRHHSKEGEEYNAIVVTEKGIKRLQEAGIVVPGHSPGAMLTEPMVEGKPQLRGQQGHQH